MNLKNLNIGLQLKCAFGVVLFLVIAIAAVAYLQTEKIHKQAETMYNHPFKVQRAVGALNIDVPQMRITMRILPMAKNGQEINEMLETIDLLDADAGRQIDILYKSYLGPGADIDTLVAKLIRFKTVRDETVRLLKAGKSEELKALLVPNGPSMVQAARILDHIRIIEDFAQKKAEALYGSSQKLRDSLHRQLIFWVAAILALSLLVISVVVRNIYAPLIELTRAAGEFRKGNYGERSEYTSGNEFGALSGAFNELAKTVQANFDLIEKSANLAKLMLSEYDTKKFFQALLNALAEYTGSQMAAVYLLSNDHKTFEHFESVGAGNNARQSFAADCFEGEFGPVLSLRKIVRIKDVPTDSRFVFNTVGGKFIPREIITVPIIAENKVIAILSLSSINGYQTRAVQLIENILVTLSARVEGIIAFHKIKEFAEILKNQNTELEAQRSELAVQSAELSEQNRELETQKQQLDESGRLKTIFLSNMSHELRTPLNSVIALSGVLNRRLAGKAPLEEYGYLEVIERNGKLLLALINDILDIARIESGKEEIETTRFSADSLIAEIVEMIEPQARQKNIILRRQKSDPDVRLESDMDKCRHILQNIIGNAVKFTEKGSVGISVRQSGETAEICVADTGIGIAESFLPHIFEEFRQADNSTSRRYGGTGLGLAIAKKYATLLGGDISATSAQGKGSTFTVTLPLRTGPGIPLEEARSLSSFQTRTTSRGAAKPVSIKPGATILLVEDSESAIIQVRDILEEHGYRIITARSGEEALGILGSQVPDGIILDLMMPGMDGFEVLTTIREADQTAHVPVLILTAKHITKEDLKSLTRNNIHQLIRKGDVNREELLSAIAIMVRAHVEGPYKTQQMREIEGRPAVLVVEDNPDNMLTMKALLSEKYTILEANDGHACMEIVKSRKPHLVLMDIALPGKNGIEAFRAIRNNPDTAHIPVIAVTASAMTGDRETILAHGFDGYVAKPIDAHKLIKCIGEALYGK